MNENDIQQYRLTALQHQLLRRTANSAVGLDSEASLSGVSSETLVQEVVARFAQAIAPVVGPDNISDLPRPSEFPLARGPFSVWHVGAPMEQLSSRSTDLLLTFDDFGSLLGGITTEYYPRESVDSTLSMLKEHIPPLVGYFAAIESLFSKASIRDLFEGMGRSWDSDTGRSLYRQSDFIRTQTAWLDAKTVAFRECVRLLLFADQHEWDKRSSQLAYVANRIRINPGLQITHQEVDEITWGLTGAAPLMYRAGSIHIPVKWTTTSRAVTFAQQQNSKSRASWLASMRDDLRNMAKEMTPDQNFDAIGRVLRRIFQPRTWDEARPDDLPE